MTPDRLLSEPPSEFYEDPYIPSVLEASSYSRIPLLPVEAHAILVNYAGRDLSEVDRKALEMISGSDDADVRMDYKVVRRKAAEKLGKENDWD